MNSSNTALQAGHHHHHHQPSTTTTNQHFHHTNPTPLHQKQPAVVNPNPSIHRFQTLNDNPWQLQSQIPQPAAVPTPPLRQHKRPAPTPPAAVTASSSLTTSLSKPTLQQLSNYNQPVFLTNSTQTTPGLAPQSVLHSQHSPKSPNQNFLHQPGNLMSTSLNSGNIASSMVNNHHLTSSQTSASHHHNTTNLSNNNNNTNFDDLNVNGTSSSTSLHKKVEMKHSTMP